MTYIRQTVGLHRCQFIGPLREFSFECYEWKGNLRLCSDGDYEILVNFCPFCGFSLNKVNYVVVSSGQDDQER